MVEPPAFHKWNCALHQPNLSLVHMSLSQALQGYAYEMDDLRTKVETDGLCVLNGTIAEAAVGCAAADDPRTLRVKKNPNHTLVYPHRIRLCIAHFLYFFHSVSMTP